MTTNEAQRSRRIQLSQLPECLDHLKAKFLNGTLQADDFSLKVLLKQNLLKSNNINNGSHKRIESSANEDSYSDCELDFEDGQILLLKKQSGQGGTLKLVTADSNDEQPDLEQTDGLDSETLRIHLRMLMETFENEKRKLDKRLEEEQQSMKRRLHYLLSKKIRMEREHYGKIISELMRLIDESKLEKEQLMKAYKLEAAARRSLSETIVLSKTQNNGKY